MYRIAFLCSHCFQSISHTAIISLFSHFCDNIFHFVDIITINSCCASFHFKLSLPIKKLVQSTKGCSLVVWYVLFPKLNRLNGNCDVSCQHNNLNFHTLMIEGFVRNVTRFFSSSSIASSCCFLSDCAGHCITWMHVPFCCKNRGHKLLLNSLLRFSTLPTSANPVHNFVCYLAFTHGHFLIDFVIVDHAILGFCSMGKGCMFSCQYGTDFFPQV